MTGGLHRVLKRIALLVLVVFGLTVAVPPDAVPAGSSFPVSWLSSVFSARPSWALAGFANPPHEQPQQWRNRDYRISPEMSRGVGGVGRRPKPVKGANPPYVPPSREVEQTITPRSGGFDPDRSRKNEDAATAHKNVFENPDGSITHEISTGAVNYRDETGRYRPIDTTLVRQDGRLTTRANSVHVSFIEAVPGAGGSSTTVEPPAGPLVQMTTEGGHVIAFDLSDAAIGAPTVSGAVARYTGVFPHTDLELEAIDAGFRETLILHSPDAATSWSFPLHLQGLSASMDDNGGVVLKDENGDTIAVIPPGYMVDSNIDPRSGEGATSRAVQFELLTVDGQQVLRKSIDENWLRDPVRVFPVRVDPSTTVFKTKSDTYVQWGDDVYYGSDNNVAIGTWDSGAHRSRTYMRFTDFETQYAGKRITSVQLKLFLTWQYNCSANEFRVYPVTEGWSIDTIRWGNDKETPNVSWGSLIGAATPTNYGDACTNTTANRAIGDWVTVDLDAATFDAWVRGAGGSTSPVRGLMIAGSKTDNYEFKRFTSRDGPSGTVCDGMDCDPYLSVTFTANSKPQIVTQYPSYASTVNTLTPTLIAKGRDPDNWPNSGLKYQYVVYEKSEKDTDPDTQVAASGLDADLTSWQVPAGVLKWNKVYLYTVKVSDYVGSNTTTKYPFTTTVPTPQLTSRLSLNPGKGFDASIGNYTTSATDASVAVPGPPLNMTRNYNSLDTSVDGAFGLGWSSQLDAQATQVRAGDGTYQTVLVTYPNGERVPFGRNGDGITFTPPAGRYSTFTELTSAGSVTGYKLIDKDATEYLFSQADGTGTFKITSIKDANGRALTWTYASGRASRVTASGANRSLHLTWQQQPSGRYYVEMVSTDPATPGDPNSASVWTYTYNSAEALHQVCGPVAIAECSTYTYGQSLPPYPNTVSDLNPVGYWRLGEAAGSTTAKSEVLKNAGKDAGQFTGVTLGQTGPFAGTTAKAAAFNGTSSRVQLPGKLVVDGRYQSVSMWFKTTAVNGVLFSYNSKPITDASAPSFVPALYVDKNGYLRGEFYIGNPAAAMKSTTVVNDGQWHHAVLAGAGNTQTLYLDGVPQASLPGVIALSNGDNAAYVYVGAGFIGGSWPDQPRAGLSSAPLYFNGSISDVAYFDQAVSPAAVASLYARRAATPLLTSITRPLGGTTAAIQYDTVSGRVKQVTDEHGGVWQLAPPKVAGSSDVYAGAVLGSGPRDYWRLADQHDSAAEITEAVNEVKGGDATFNNVVLGVPGKFPDATAAQFNGTDSSITSSNSSIDTSNSYTVSAWVRLTAKGGNKTAVSVDGSRRSGFFLGYGHTNDRWRFTMCTNDTDTGTCIDSQSTAVPPLNTWTHLTGVFDKTTNRLKLYVNGQLQGDVAVTTVWAATASLVIGRDKSKGNLGGYWPGEIGDVATYGKALSVDQVQAQYGAAQQTAALAVTVVDGTTKELSMPVSVVEVTGPTPTEKTTDVYDIANGFRLVSATDPLGNVTKYGYDIKGFSSLIYNPNGVAVERFQDKRGNTIQTRTCQNFAAQLCTDIYYSYHGTYANAADEEKGILVPDARNDALVTIRDAGTNPPNGTTLDDRFLTTYGYDAKGNRITVTDPLGRVDRTEYTDGTTIPAFDSGFAPPGLPWRITSPGGAVETIDYFANGDAAKITTETGSITTYAYDGLGRVVTETTVTSTFPAGLVTTYEYDKIGRVVKETRPQTTNRVTQAAHRLQTASTFDADGNMLTVEMRDVTGGDPPRSVEFNYNAKGQRAWQRDQTGIRQDYEYDLHGRVSKEIYADGSSVETTYDANGNERQRIQHYPGQPDVVLADNHYDPAGRLTVVIDPLGYETWYEYTDNNLLLRTTRCDRQGQPFANVKCNSQQHKTMLLEEYTYDLSGNVTKQVTNNGTRTETFVRDNAARLTSATLDPGASKLNQTSEFTYSPDDHVLTTTVKDWSGDVWGKAESLYDAAGRELAKTTYTSNDLTPVARWKLDEATGTTAADSTGNSALTVSGNVSWTSAHGGAAVLDGESWLETAGPAVDTSRSYSVAVWVNLANKDSSQRIVAANGDVQSAFDVRYHQANNRWLFAVKQGDYSNSPGASAWSTSVPAAGTWTHLAGTFNSATKEMTLYVNGVAEGTSTVAAYYGGKKSVTVGRGVYNSASVDFLDGMLDDVQVYQEALSGSEVSAIYGGTAPAANAKVIRTSYQRNEAGHLTAQTDPNGRTSYFEVDELGRQVASTSPEVTVERFGQAPYTAVTTTLAGYNTYGEQTDAEDSNGNWTAAVYDVSGRIISQKLPGYTPPGSSTQLVPQTLYGYDPITGELATVVDPLNKTTSYEYDRYGRVKTVTAPDLTQTHYEYNILGATTRVEDATGAVTTATYDFMARQTKATQYVRQPVQKTLVTNYEYNDPSGQLSKVISPRGVTTQFTYNADGQVLTTTDGAGKITRNVYDGAGQHIRTTLPDNTYTASQYDLAGRHLKTEWFDGQNAAALKSTSQTYDSVGNVLSSTDARGNTTTYEYDATDGLIKQIEPISNSDSITSTFGYDAAGNRTRFTDGRGSQFWTTYNPWGLPESQIEPATSAFPNLTDRTFTTVYDAAARPVRQEMPGGVSLTVQYDDMGRVERQSGTGAEAVTVDRVFDYDDAGRPVKVSVPGGTNQLTYDDRGQLLMITGPSGNSSFTYNDDGQVLTRNDAAGVTTYGYDTAGRVASVNNPSTGVQVGYTYNDLSQPSKITYGGTGNERHFTYDTLHQVKTDHLKRPAGSGGATIAKIEYGWDLNSNLSSKITTGFAGAVTNTYQYDFANRLIEWDNGVTPVIYAYDKSGNRVQSGGRTFTYDQRNQLLTSPSAGETYQYTARGTLRNKIVGSVGVGTEMDAFGQVRKQYYSATESAEYSYDGLGRAIKPGFSYTGPGNQLAADGTAQYTRGIDGELLGVQQAGAQRLAWTDLHTDVVGQFAATGVSLAGSATYDPLGKVVATSSMLGNLGFQQEWTEQSTGRVNMHARWYNPDTGQFDSRDTMSLDPSPSSIRGNRYQYGDGSPLVNTDPTGHYTAGVRLDGVDGQCYGCKRETKKPQDPPPPNEPTEAEKRAQLMAQFKASASKQNSVSDNLFERQNKFWGEAIDGPVIKCTKRYALECEIDQTLAHIASMKQALAAAWVDLKSDPAKFVLPILLELVLDAIGWNDVKDCVTKLDLFACGSLIVSILPIGKLAKVVKSIAKTVDRMLSAYKKWRFIVDTAKKTIDNVTGLIKSAQKKLDDLRARFAKEKGKELPDAGNGPSKPPKKTTPAPETKPGKTNVNNPKKTDPAPKRNADKPRKEEKKRKTQEDNRQKDQNRQEDQRQKDAGESCPIHSFAPDTRVLMADGSTRPIADVNVGDEVAATDPETGKTTTQSVTMLHLHRDEELTDVTVSSAPLAQDNVTESGEGDGGRSTRGPTVSTLETTAHHPFWDATTGDWVDAADLEPGKSTLIGPDGQIQYVTEVRNFTGSKKMRDLTVATVHTYYVIAGETPVLVHNCGGKEIAADYRANPNNGVGGRRNVAVAQYDIDGVRGQLIGVSGKHTNPGSIGAPTNRRFDPGERPFDSENKILEDLAGRLNPNSRGTINLFSERAVCPSCQGVVNQFKEMFPGIKINVTSG